VTLKQDISEVRGELARQRGRIQEAPIEDLESEDDDLEPEYDFSGAERGKYRQRYQQGAKGVPRDSEEDLLAAMVGLTKSRP
jgi:hypothetical protein